MSGGISSGPERGPAKTEGERGGWFDQLRTAVVAKTPEDVDRELPGLVSRVKSLGEETEGAGRLIIGVSFTPNHTCLDYSIDRVVENDRQDDPTVETLKEPVSSDHRYVRMSCPADPHFDAGALRSLVLAAVDRERRATTGRRTETTGIARLWEEIQRAE